MEGNVRITIPVEDRSPVFSLCRKAELLGTVPVDHWWMQKTALYGQRARRAKAGGNFHAVTSAFWALCGREGAQHEPETQESYLLARLVPFARNQGSRRVFVDACLDPPRSSPDSAYQKSPEELEPLLHSTRTKRMSRLDFQRKTGDALGPPQLDNDTTTTYRAFCEDLFAPARELLPADEAGAVERVIARWQWWMGSIGRRGGQARQKLVLDVLSYEARAALHRCYSAAWDMLLLPYLQKHYRLSPASVTFLRLWHIDQAEESNLGEQ
ncbi:MAG TPA: hypothetical protein VKD72_32050, partial [Gemmataceae bacterium]|nr:hypothetical protein [Gemmataceae bacterium]